MFPKEIMLWYQLITNIFILYLFGFGVIDIDNVISYKFSKVKLV